MNIKNILISLFVIIVSGCEDDKVVAITDNAVYSEFFVKYERATDRTTGTALFWDGNRTKRLIFHSAAKLLFEDTPMDYRSSDYSYVKELLIFHTPATFKITDVNSETFINSISINSIDFPAADLDTIDSSQPLTIAWRGKDGFTGTALEENETVSIRIENVSALQDSNGSRSVTFTLADFAKLDALKGTVVTFTIERIKTIQPLPNPLGGGLGTISGQYIAPPRTVYLK